MCAANAWPFLTVPCAGLWLLIPAQSAQSIPCSRKRPASPHSFATPTFCDVCARWQKGGVENANGCIRRWLPRKANLDEITDEEIQDIAMSISITPGKCLSFKSPIEAFLKEFGKDMTIRFNTNVALRS